MCSTIVQAVFNILLVAGTGLTVAALLVPSWLKVEEKNGKVLFQQGFFDCVKNSKECVTSFWKTLDDAQKTTLSCLILSVIVCAAALVLSLVFCCCLCCLKGIFAFIFPILSASACILDIIGLAVFSQENGQNPLNDLQTQEFGSSVWLGVGAILVLFVDTIVGVIFAKVASVSPI